MKIKLTLTQLEAMLLLLTVMLKAHTPADMPAKLLHEIVDNVADKVERKVKKATSSAKVMHSLQLTSIEAKGLYCWYIQRQTWETRKSYHYESIVAQGMIDQIDQYYA